MAASETRESDGRQLVGMDYADSTTPAGRRRDRAGRVAAAARGAGPHRRAAHPHPRVNGVLAGP